jgi:DNA-binding transcriptional LysR family regulator
MAQPSPTLRELAAFRALLRTRSATGAAVALRVTQPAISKALRQLEADMGIALFERVGGRLHPTPEAELLLPAVDNVLASMTALANAGQAIRDQRVGQVTVGAIPTLSNVFLPAAIEAVARQHPEVRIAVQTLPTRQIVEAVARGFIELGLVHDIVDDPLVHAEDIGVSAMACVVPENHPFARRKQIRARDLAGRPSVSFPAQSPIGLRLSAAFEAEGETFAPTMEVGASTVVCSLALQCGIPGIVEEYVLSLGWWPGLRAVPLAPAIPLRPRILTTRQRPVSAAGKLLRDKYRALVQSVLRPATASP